uniref:Uncharacterized protein n=1 Tax=Oryza punctata TaxID=4537 RepID=A0A0E0KH02_ORYPU
MPEEEGAATAVSGCYAGPLVQHRWSGWGLSLTLAAGSQYPAPFAIPAAGRCTRRWGSSAPGWHVRWWWCRHGGMRLDRVYGMGLIAIYLAFVTIRVFDSLGLWTYSWWPA